MPAHCYNAASECKQLARAQYTSNTGKITDRNMHRHDAGQLIVITIAQYMTFTVCKHNIIYIFYI